MKHLVMFCDYGLDDAIATYDVLNHADGFDRIDLVAVGGNVPSEISLRNAQKLVAFFPRRMANVRIVDTTAFAQPHEFLQLIHGNDGMGDLFEERTGATVVPFGRWLEGKFEGCMLLSVGPMTMVEPFLKGHVPQQFVFMGGNIAEEPNYRGYEFNHGVNRRAFSACVRYPHVAVTMDTCRNPLFNVQEKEIGCESMMLRMVARSKELTKGTGEKGCYIWDDIAVKAMRHPEWFDCRTQTDKDGNVLNVAYYRGEREYLSLIDE